MTDTAVTPFPGVTRRTDSTRWHFVLRAPQELLHRFDGSPWAVRCSLGTSDLRQANDKARALHAEWAAKFAAMRLEENAQAAEKITPDMAAVLAQRVARKVLQADEELRKDPEAVQAWGRLMESLKRAAVDSLKINPTRTPARPLPSYLTAELDPWEGLPGELLAGLGELNEAGERSAADALSRQRVATIERQAQAEARALGFTFSRSTPGALEAMRACLGAYREAWASVRARDAGAVVPTPPLSSLPQEAAQAPAAGPQQAKQGHTPRDAFDAWAALPGKSGQARPERTLDTYRAAADKLAEFLKGRTLESMTREDGRDFVVALLADAQARGRTAQNTAVHTLSRWKTLLSQAVDLEWIGKNPLQGRTIARVKSPRKPWTPADLVRLFDHPTFTRYSIPTAARAGLDAAYWLPLLGLYTGARITELAQLGIGDLLNTQDARWVLSIHEEGEGQSVKNAHSVRQVPVHPELIRLGLVDYWQAVKDAGALRLWPAVVFCKKNGAGGEVSKHFGAFKTAQGFGPELVFHSFRHTLETELRALSVPKYHIAALAGHAAEDISDGYAHPTPAVLRPHLERLKFPGLSLPRVFTAPVWKPRKD